jgi:transposase
MSRGNASTPITRYVALNIHRTYLTVGAVDSQQQIVLTPRRFGFESFSAWAATHVSCSYAVVLKATANAWMLYDQLTPLAGSVTVAHPLAVKLISAARVKTDARDTLKLARLLAANLIPAVWVPPVAVREVRALVTHRKRLVKQRTQARNRLQGVLQRHNLSAPEGAAFALKARAWWLSLPLSPAEQLRVRQDLTLLETLDPLIAEVEAQLGQLSTDEQWSKLVPFLLQLPGLGMLSAMTILAAIGDIARFPSAKHLIGYAGLGTRIHASGQVQRGGGITRRVVVSSERLWWRLPGSLSSIMLIGKGNLSDSAHALANTRRLLSSPASCWWPSGTCSAGSRLISMPACRPSPAHYSAGPRAVARLPANAAPRPRSCVTTLINWDLEKKWKQSTTVVESIAS